MFKKSAQHNLVFDSNLAHRKKHTHARIMNE